MWNVKCLVKYIQRWNRKRKVSTRGEKPCPYRWENVRKAKRNDVSITITIISPSNTSINYYYTYWKFTISPTTLCYPQTKKLRFVFLLIIPLDVPWNPRKVAQSVNLALEWLVHRETRLSIVSCHGTETITGSIPLRSRCVKRYRGSHRAFVENEAGMRELEFGALNVSWTVAIGRRWWNERTDGHRTRGKAIWRWFVMHARRSPPK